MCYFCVQMSGAYQSVIVPNEASLDLRKKVSAVEQFIRSPIKKRPYNPKSGGGAAVEGETVSPSNSPPLPQHQPQQQQVEPTGTTSSGGGSSGGRRAGSGGEPRSKRRRTGNARGGAAGQTTEPGSSVSTTTLLLSASSSVESPADLGPESQAHMLSKTATHLPSDAVISSSSSAFSSYPSRSIGNSVSHVGSSGSPAPAVPPIGSRPIAELLAQTYQPPPTQRQHALGHDQVSTTALLHQAHHRQLVGMSSSSSSGGARGLGLARGLGGPLLPPRPLGREELKLTVPHMIARLHDSYNSTFTFLRSKLAEMQVRLAEYTRLNTMDSMIGKIISTHLKAGNQVRPEFYLLFCC